LPRYQLLLGTVKSSYGLTDTLNDHDINIYTLETGPGTQIFPAPTGLVDVVEVRIDTVDGVLYELQRATELSADPGDWESTGASVRGDGIMRGYYSSASGFNGMHVFESTIEPVNNDGLSASSLGYAALFGQNVTETERGMVGDLAVVRFYRRALAPEEIEKNFNATGPGLGVVAATPLPDIAAVSALNSVGLRFTGEAGALYELHGSNDGTTFTPTGARVRGTGGEQYAFDPDGMQKAAYQMIAQQKQ
jgi:hypothetical protein